MYILYFHKVMKWQIVASPGDKRPVSSSMPYKGYLRHDYE